MKLVYIAGPLRAETAYKRELNIREAERVMLELYHAGYAPICPHSMTRFIYGAVDEAVCMDADIEVIKRCDAVVLCGDPETSEGTKNELEWAEKYNVPVFYSVNDLADWSGKSCMNCKHGMKKEKEHPCSVCNKQDRNRAGWEPKRMKKPRSWLSMQPHGPRSGEHEQQGENHDA